MLAKACPQLAAEWHPTHNKKRPADVSCGSNRKVWWLCQEGQCGHEHVWQATVQARAQLLNGCPICAGKKPCQCTSLAAIQPETVQQQWDFERNTVRPEDLLPQSHKEVYWRCTLHQPIFIWTARPNDRFSSHESGCPECALDRRRTLKAAGYS